MKTQQLPDLRNDKTFARLADEFANDQRTISAIEKLKETFERAFFAGAIKGIRAGHSIYCKERSSFDYVTPDADDRYSNLLYSLSDDAHATNTIKRVYYDVQLGFLNEALHCLFIEGAQYGLRKGYELGEHENKKNAKTLNE